MTNHGPATRPFMTIDGKPEASPELLDVINPATEEVVGQVPLCSAAQLDAAVASARRALAGWRDTDHETRGKALNAIADRLEANIDELALMLTREHGKPLGDARMEFARTAQALRAFADFRIPQHKFVNSSGQEVTLRRTPLGVVAAIAPFNFPIVLAMWKVAPALMTGNTVVLKPSPFTPMTTLRIGELLREVLPPGVLNIISGDDALGPMLSAHKGVDKITFTGSTATGKRVMETASRDLKRITLELGGNDPAIVLPDVDVEEVALRIFWGAFANCGQICIAAKRIYVHDSIYDRFLQLLKDLAAANLPQNGEVEGARLGPVQNRVQYQRVRAMIDGAKESGVSVWEPDVVLPSKGFFIAPTLADNPPDSAPVVAEEPFGPFLPLLRFTDVDDAIRRANDSEYGLAASVWTNDRERAEYIAERLDCGTVWINSVLGLSPDTPFSGHKHSGIGVENGIDGMLEYTAIQAIVG